MMSLNHRLTNALPVVTLQAVVHPCSQCSRGFLSKRECTLHEICHVQATTKSQTYRRIVDKHSEKPFECENCDARFMLWSTLEAHSVIHQPYPYVCHCGIGYYSKKDFQGHKFVIHSGPLTALEPNVEIIEEEEIHNDELYKELTKQIERSEIKIEQDNDNDDVDDYEDDVDDDEDDVSEYEEPVVKKRVRQPYNKTTRTKNTSKSKTENNKLTKKASDAVAGSDKPKRRKMQNENDVEVHKGPNGYVCPKCPFSKRDYRKLVEHYAEHVDKMPYACEQCLKPFLLQVGVEKHVKLVHSNTKDYTCRYCGKKFGSLLYLQKHIYTHTGEKPFKCDECGKCFSQAANLYGHKQRHLNLREYVCKVCDKRFNCKANLLTHENIHRNLRQYKCAFCPKGFNDRSAYNRHERIHTGQVMYTCQFCQKPFTDYSAYAVHKRRHENDRKYPCDRCEKKFYTKSDMIKHSQIHEQVRKQFECDICSKNLSSKHSLTLHLAVVHAKLKHKCKFCKMKFSPNVIKNHMKGCRQLNKIKKGKKIHSPEV